MSITGVWDAFVDFYAARLRDLADFFSFLGGHKWAAAIIVMTVIVKTLLLPLAVKQIRSMREMQRLAPEMQRLKQKYRNDRQKMTQETMALYQREGVNPYASCLPIFAQMPVIFAFYQALQNRILNLGARAPALAEQLKAKEITAATALQRAQDAGAIPEMPFLGLGDLAQPASSTIAGWLLIVLMTAAQLITTRQLNPGQDERQRRMQMFLPLLFIVFFINFPAALVLYWATQSMYQLVQQMIMTRGQRAKGWRAWIGIAKPEVPSRGAAKRDQAAKPQVKAQIKEPVAAAAGTSSSFDALATRRQLEEKRQRRRRNKKRKRRR